MNSHRGRFVLCALAALLAARCGADTGRSLRMMQTHACDTLPLRRGDGRVVWNALNARVTAQYDNRVVGVTACGAVAWDSVTGHVVWTYAPEGVVGTACVYTHAGRLACSMYGHENADICGLDPQTGRELWCERGVRLGMTPLAVAAETFVQQLDGNSVILGLDAETGAAWRARGALRETDNDRLVVTEEIGAVTITRWLDAETGSVVSETPPAARGGVEIHGSCTSQDVTTSDGGSATEIDCTPNEKTRLTFPFVALRADESQWVGYGTPRGHVPAYSIAAAASLGRVMLVDRTTRELIALGNTVVRVFRGDLKESVGDSRMCLRQESDLNRCMCFRAEEMNEHASWAWLDIGLAVNYVEHRRCPGRDCLAREDSLRSAILRTQTCPDIAASAVEPYVTPSAPPPVP